MSGNPAARARSAVYRSPPEEQWDLVRRLPAPRRVRARENTQLAYAALIFCLLIPLVFFGYLAWQGLARESLRWLPGLPIVLIAATLPCIYSLRAWRRRRLMIRGVAGEATVANIKAALKGPYTHVSYVFQVDGQPRHGIVPVLSGADQISPGQKLGMLFDPVNPKVNDLFFLAFGSYLIVPPAVAHRPEGDAD